MKKQHLTHLTLVFTLLLTLSSFAFAQDDSSNATPFIGVRFSTTDDGLMVDAVVEESPAEEAGLAMDDLITEIDGEAVTAENIREVLGSYTVGDEITLTVVRDDETLDVSLTLVEYPERLRANRAMPRGLELDVPFAEGLLSLSMEDGAIVIEEVDEESPLAEAGFEAGDRIIAINGVELDDLRNNLELLLQSDMATVTVERGDETIDLEIEGNVLPMFIMPRQGSEFGEFFGFDLDQPDDRFEFAPRGGNRNQARLGVQFITLNEDNASDYETDLTDGAFVIQVIENSPAEEAGLQSGDVVVAVDGDLVDLERTLPDRLFAYEPGDIITLDVVRDGETIQVEVTLGGQMDRASFQFDGFPNFFTVPTRDFFNAPFFTEPATQPSL